MSNTDSFIEEVTEEVRRDQLFKMLKRYGWVVAAVIVLGVAWVGWSEYQKAQTRAAAEAVGDGLLNALSLPEGTDRVAALQGVETEGAEAAALVAFLTASEQARAGDAEAATVTLQEIVNSNGLPLVYRQIAQFKALGLSAATTSIEDRRSGYSALAQPGNAMRLLSEEQLALLDIEAGDAEAAIARLQSIVNDAESTADLQQRALQVIVALGGEPDLSALQSPQGGN